MFANAKLAIANNGYNGIISKEMLGYSSFQKVDFLQNSLQGKEDRIMKSRKATLIQLLKRNLATVLIMVLLPIIPIQIAKAESLSISIGAAIEGQKISFSWNSITNAVRYEYSVRDLTTNELLISHEETTKTSGSIPASYVIKDHQYKVWVGAFFEVAEDNMPEAIANSYITECAKKEKSTLYGTTYEQYNDTYHKRYDVYDITCKVCGDHIEYRNETTKEKHTMKNGKCTVCGYEEEPDPLDVVVSRNQAKAQVGDSIGATAEITGGSGSYLRDWTVTCDGETITTSSNNESEFNWIASKAGSWKFKITVLDNNTGEKVSDTSSAITVTEAECTHENTTETLIDTEYIQKNENHHTVRNFYRITCSNPSCGAILNSSYYKDTDEAHTFGTDRNCEKCGYVPPTEECNHENITSELLRTELRQCDSDNNHYSVAIYKDVCSDCGVTIKEEREVITLVLHEFVNGVCACGFSEPTPECDHATTRDKISTVLEQYSDTAHRMVITYHVYCECGQVDYEEEIKSFPEHQFDSNGLCECGYQKVEETSVSFSADKTEVTVGENVTFTITTNATSVDFVADGTAYNTVEVTGGRATYVRAFTEQGDRQIKFVAPDGTSSDTKTIRVTAKGQLDQTTISVPSSVEEGNSVTASWTAVDHAENYVARLYDDVPTELWKQETTGTSVTIPANLLEADKHYTVSVIATGTDYTQSESSAGFVVNAKQEEIVINGAFGQDSYTITAGETLDVAVSASVQNANLTRVTINVDGSDNNRLSSKEISGTSWNGALTLDGTAAPLNVPGTYTIKLFVGVDAGDPNWAEVDQATLTVTAPEEDNPKLPDPVIISPTAGDVLENTTFTLSWNAVNGADHYVYTASDLSQDAVKVIPVTATNGLSVELTLPEKGHNYRAAVGAVPAGVNDNESDKISWSTVEFSVQAEPKQLADPTITYPSNGAVLDSTSVTVSWNDVDGAVDFAISVYDITSDKYIADRELTDYAFNAVINDLEWFHQYRVAVGAVPRKANGDSTKYSWSTVEFSVARAFIGTPTLEATGYYSVNGDPTYRVTVITDGHITRLSGVNDTGTPLNETWDKTSNADGTITWVRVYTPGMSANNRTWTLTAWVGDQQIEQATTNAASMHVHTYGAKKYKDAHPHQYYQVCTVCNHELLLSNQYYTANGTVQDPAVCCVCHGHQYGDAYEENGAWYQKCSKCGKIMTATNIPITASDETIYDFDATKSILIARLNDNWAGYGDKVFGEAYRTWTQGFMAIDLYIADVGGNLDFIKIATDVVNLIWEQGEQGINKAVDLLNGLGIDIDRAILQEIYQSIREITAENLHPIFAGLTRDEIKLIAEILDESTEKALSDVKKNTKVVNDNLKAINSVVKELNEQLPDSETGIKEETLYDVYDKIMDFIDANTGKEIFVDGVHRSGLNEKMASMLENVLDGERVDFLDRANFEKWLEKIKGTEKGLKIIGKIVKVGKIVVNEAVYQETLLSFSDIQQAQIEIAKNATNDARLKTALSQLQKQISDHTYSIIKNSTDSSIDFLLDELADYALKLNPYTGIAKFVLQVVNAITPNVQKKFDAIKEFTKMYDLTVAVKNAAIEKITNMPQNPTQEDLNDLRLYLDTYISYMEKLSVKYDAMLSFNNEKNNAPQNISMDNFKQMIDAILNTYQIGGIE